MTTLVFDGSSLFARSFYAAQRLSANPRDALRLAVNTITLLLDPNANKIGTYIDSTLFAWDSQQNKLKNRSEKPLLYHETKDILKDAVAYLFGTVNVEQAETEADDIVATAVNQIPEQDIVYVVSADKDLMQLQGGHCQFYSLHDKAVLSASYILRKFGNIKRTSQIALALAIIGDKVDNIPGIKGYGEARCKKLFEAVTPEMEFATAMDVIAAQLPEQQLVEFYEALNRTLLRRDLANIPAPAPLKLLPPYEAENLGIPQIGAYYRQICQAYAA